MVSLRLRIINPGKESHECGGITDFENYCTCPPEVLCHEQARAAH